jgi:hypothetical protein
VFATGPAAFPDAHDPGSAGSSRIPGAPDAGILPEQRTGERGVGTIRPFPVLLNLPMIVGQIVEKSRQWPEDVVAERIDRVTLAKHGRITPERDAAWVEVAARRSAELASGQAKLWRAGRRAHPKESWAGAAARVSPRR